jgi:orotidine-5'-phosphate decarboxylase
MKHMGLKAGCPYKKTNYYINETYPAIFTTMQNVVDRNTSSMPKLFEDLNFDSVTVAPYMGKIQWNLPCL